MSAIPRLRFAESATRFFEPGERMLAAAPVVEGPKAMIRVPALALLTLRFRLIAVTGANVYVFAVRAPTGTRCSRLMHKRIRGSIEVRFVPGLDTQVSPRPAILGLPGSGADWVIRRPGKLHVGRHEFWVRARDANDAWEVSRTASPNPS